MAGKIRYLLNRNGRYFARLVIPEQARPFLDGKSELRTPLGADRKEALRRHPFAIAELMHKISQAERRASEVNGEKPRGERYPLTLGQMALFSYQARLAQDEAARNQGHEYAQIGIDNLFVAKLRKGIGGALSDDELEELVGHRIDRFRAIGSTDAEVGTENWRSLARAICVSEYEALARILERDEGHFDGQPVHPLLRDAQLPQDDPPPVSLQGLFEEYMASRRRLQRGREAERRWAPVFKRLRSHLGHDDARRVSKMDLIAWRDELLNTLSPKTVSSVHLAAVRTVFAWAVRENRLAENPAELVRQEAPKRTRSREAGYTLSEGTAVLRASAAYERSSYKSNAHRELAETAAAKRWVPLLCAHTGARVVEMTQLLKQDIRQDHEGSFTIRISPDAGSVKTGQFRDVPLHTQIVDEGFVEFVAASPEGPLFYRSEDGVSLDKARIVADRISQWLRTSGLIPAGVKPSHGWRHRFKTVSRELGLSERVTEAICGHASRTAGDDYGDVTVAAMRKVIDAMPPYDLKKS